MAIGGADRLCTWLRYGNVQKQVAGQDTEKSVLYPQLRSDLLARTAVLLIFGVWLKWFPIGFSSPIGVLSADVTFWQKLYHMVLPAFTLSLMSFANIALHTRQKLVDVLNSEYVLFAKARGESPRTILRRHGLRNILFPALTLQFASFAELFGGSVMAENVFSYPGLGSAVSAAGLRGDVPLLLGITLFSALFVCVGNMIANLLYGVIDPQVKEVGE